MSTAIVSADFELGDDDAARPVRNQTSNGSGNKNVIQKLSQDHNSGQVPSLISLGDIPTAYMLMKYELSGDIRFYQGGGVMAKAFIGVWPRFFFGGAVNIRNFVGSGNMTLNRDDASVIARLLLIKEKSGFPAVSLGWDGPSYAGTEVKGLYLVASKEFSTVLGYFQMTGGVNSKEFEDFVLDEDLRGFAGLSTMIANVLAFVEVDEIFHPVGPRINTGLRIQFDPISLGLEFQDLGSTRTSSTRVSRMLRVSYTGLF